MKAFCTIISPDFLPFAECLFTSLKRYDEAIVLHVLVTVAENKPMDRQGISFYSLNELDAPYLKQLKDQYQGINDNFRWSLKPIFLLHLLQRIERLIYVDADGNPVNKK